jgi:hypothetical protein
MIQLLDEGRNYTCGLYFTVSFRYPDPKPAPKKPKYYKTPSGVSTGRLRRIRGIVGRLTDTPTILHPTAPISEMELNER